MYEIRGNSWPLVHTKEILDFAQACIFMEYLTEYLLSNALVVLPCIYDIAGCSKMKLLNLTVR